MATITGLTADRMQQIIDKTIVSANIVGGHLILTLSDGSTVDAGTATGPQGPPGIQKVTAFPTVPAPTDGDMVIRTDMAGDPVYKYTTGSGWVLLAGGLAKVTAFPATPADGDGVVRTDLNGSPIFMYSTENGWEQLPRMGAQTVPSCRVTKAPGDSLANGANVAIPFNAEDYDTDSMHDNVTNSTRITINTPGVYLLRGSAGFTASANGQRQIFLYKNGVLVQGALSNDTAPNAGSNSRLEVTAQLRLAAGDYIELIANQSSGATITTSDTSVLSATWMGGPGQTVDERGVPAARLYKSATQSGIPTGVDVALTWDQEEYDTDSIHDVVTNNTRMTIKTPGLYRFSCGIAWNSDTVNLGGVRNLRFRKNGTTYIGESDNLPNTDGAHTWFQQASCESLLAAGDYVEVLVNQDSGGSKVVGAGANDGRNFFTASLIGSGKTVTPYTRVRKSADQATTNNVAVAVSWNLEDADNDSIHDIVTNNTRLTCRTAGVYLVTGAIAWQGNAAGTIRELALLKNGVIVENFDYLPTAALYIPPFAGLIELAVGDYVEITAFQNSGGAMNVVAANSHMEMVKIGGPSVGNTNIEAIENWHTVGAAGEPAFQNSWQTATVLKFKKDRGVTYITGTIGVTGNAGTVFTLPPGYRPISDAHRTFQRDNAGATALVDVNTDGTVTSSFSKASGGWVNMGMSFRND